MESKKHPVSVPGYTGSVKELGQDILRGIAEDIERQSETDKARGREKLASDLKVFYGKLMDAAEEGEIIWGTCKHFMKEELEED